MKTFIKNLVKTLFVASVLFTGVSFAHATGDFIGYDPMGGSHGITSVTKTGFSSRGNYINASIPNNGDEQTFTVYIAYQNIRSNNILNGAKASLDFDEAGTGNTAVLKGVLTGSSAEYKSDTAEIRNLPSSWSLIMTSAKKINTHVESSYPECTGSGAPYNYNLNMSSSFLTGGSASIDHLDYVGQWNGVTGSCDQGYVVATFELKNTVADSSTDLDIVTNQEIMGSTNVTLKGHLASADDATVWFVMREGNSNLNCNDTHLGTQYHKNTGYDLSYDVPVSSLNPGSTYYYRACALDAASQTDYESLNEDFMIQEDVVDTIKVKTYTVGTRTTNSAVLRGSLVEGDDVNTWFIISTSENDIDDLDECSDSALKFHLEYGQNAPHQMDATKSGLSAGTHYYYKACGKKGSTEVDGVVKDFVTLSNGTTLSVSTGNYNLSGDHATLNGEITGDSSKYTYFVYGPNQSVICNGVSPEDHMVNSNQNGTTVSTGENFNVNTVSLTPGTYYYRACAKKYSYSTPVSGGLEHFTISPTDNENLNVDTYGVTGLGNNYATLNGKLVEGENVHTWFVFDYAGNNLVCDNFSQQISHKYEKDAGYVMAFTKTELAQSTHYHYKACASRYSSITGLLLENEGSVEDFTTGSLNTATYYWNSDSDWSSCINNMQTRNVWCEKNLNGTISNVNDVNCVASERPDSSRSCDNSKPDPETFSPRSVDVDSAKLRGEVDMNDYDNGFIFFVYGTSESRVDDVSTENRYGDIDEHGQKLQKISVDNDLDGRDDYSKSVYNLDTNTRYYYRICVDYDRDGSDDIRCGTVEDFKTGYGNDDGEDTIDIRTEGYSNVTNSSAKICGNLIDKGDRYDALRFMEYRRDTTSWTQTGNRYASEGYYCTNMTNLRPNTRYYYRACTQYGCGNEAYFVTGGNYQPTNKLPVVSTDTVKVAYPHSAILPGFYVSNAENAKVWFNYGHSQNLGSTTTRQTVYGNYGEYVHNFTGLKSNQLYCYQSMIETVNGVDSGAIKCFRTPAAQVITPTRPYVRPRPVEPVVEVVEEDKTEIDLSKLGLGLSLIRLDIDDEVQTVTKGQNVTYYIRWENISDIDLDTLDLNIEIPREVRITASSRGKLDQDRNSIFYTIDRLDAGEENSMTVNGIVENGSLGDALTAEAAIAFDNPLNRAQENARDYDVDDYVIQTAMGTASVFGLANITLLGWLTILLGLFIVFLVARWLYLEREELRAQAYVNGYGRNNYVMAPAPVHNGYIAPAPQAQPMHHYVEPVHVAPQQVVHHQAPMQAAPVVPVQTAPMQQAAPIQTAPQNVGGERADYRPYRPNRG